MTRGTFVLITDDRILISVEFNGDMYFFDNGYGEAAMEAIRNVCTSADFVAAVRDFNRSHHNYDLDADMIIHMTDKVNDSGIDVANNKLLLWTDYTFYKNASSHDVMLHCDDNAEVQLNAHCSMALHYGKADDKYIPEIYRRNYPENEEGSDSCLAEDSKQNTQTGYRRLFIIRKDLQMSPGKLASQVAHCAEAYWLHVIKSWEAGQIGSDRAGYTGNYRFIGDLNGGIYENYVNGTITKTICEARNKTHLLKAKEKAEELGLKEGLDFGLIRDLCLTELKPEDEDGRTTTGLWFRPLPDDVSHEISRKYQLYK